MISKENTRIWKISVIIHPSDEFITQVTVLKDQLKNEIGWYNSCHSRAHITVCELDSEEIELKEIKNQLTHISYRLQSKQVKFTSFNTFENGTFFMTPEPISKHYLEFILQEIHSNFTIPVRVKNFEPHITIGRRLTTFKIKKAKQLFNQPLDLSFECSRIALRVFNKHQKQYEIIGIYPFMGRTKGIEL